MISDACRDVVTILDGYMHGCVRSFVYVIQDEKNEMLHTNMWLDYVRTITHNSSSLSIYDIRYTMLASSAADYTFL